ncbi:MAG: ATP-dependent DNA helicase RecG [Lachnospiraceae bacterium]|nr:ATP-dependent DNA helicase RecG [Lachnospiraceae bacterium]
MNESSNITELKGIGEKTAALFHKVGVYSLWDLMTYYPRDYEQYEEPVKVSECKQDCMVTLRLTIRGNLTLKKVRNLNILTGLGGDETGGIMLTWFQMPYLKNTLKSGNTYLFRGMVKAKGSALVMEQPKIYQIDEYKKLIHTLQPIYSVTKGLTGNGITKMVTQALMEVPEYEDYLTYKDKIFPDDFEVMEMNQAIRTMHFPTNYDEVIKARKRLVFDEFLFFLLGIRQLKEQNYREKNHFPMMEVAETNRLIESLTFQLTKAQIKTWKEIMTDMSGENSMNRLVQGDVGSGKTIVAILALVMAACNGYQGAIMAPTEVLATQHMESFITLFRDHKLSLTCVLLTGSMTAKEKREAREMIEAGAADIIIGTHALLQEKVHYKNLALVVTDEQHRFGVKQRETLAQKSSITGTPHVLVMSATPIPRTLAIIIYGDLDISVMNELPAERLPIRNCVVNQNYRQKAYEFICKEVTLGRQAYVICPMVEESENLDVENVTDYTKRLKEILPSQIQVDYLHGKMKPKEKNEIMERFANNDIQVLVSTTVVEVGVNVPNATVMMVENAERFGLAQLHQLRGRVGRGRYQSFCIFVSGNDNKETMQRLDILNHSNDGFKIAEEDLRLRGPGDFFGFRQSGDMNFKIGDIFTDATILKYAADYTNKVLTEDYDLSSEKYAPMKKRLSHYMQNQFGKICL